MFQKTIMFRDLLNKFDTFDENHKIKHKISYFELKQ